jgi:SAM-dependent methyltransferase
VLPEKDSRILDAGCGNGFLAGKMAELGHEVTGIDLNEETLTVVREHCGCVRFERASVYDDLAALRPRGGWDAVVSSEVIQHLFSPQRFLQNMRRQLRPDGVIIIVARYHGYWKNLAIAVSGNFDKHFEVGREGGLIKCFSATALEAMLQQTGFREVSFRYAGRVPYLWKVMICRAVAARESETTL